MSKGWAIIVLLILCHKPFIGQPFSNLELDALSATEFETLWELSDSERSKILDSNGFLSHRDIKLDRHCHEICEDYLIHGRDTIVLDCDYDQGIEGLLFSPSMSRLMTHSSYDGPDFHHFYAQRSEIFLYQLGKADEDFILDSLAHWTNTEYSISRSAWKDERRIALELYSGERSSAGVDGGFIYGILTLED